VTARQETFEYYDFRAINSRNALWRFVAGPRSIGKTFGSKIDAVKRAIHKGEQTLWIRRTDTELGPAKARFFDTISREYPGFDFRVDGNVGLVKLDGGKERVVCGFMPLSLADQYKGTEFPNVTRMTYDEIYIKPGSNMRYLPDEVDALRELWITVNRGRTDSTGRAVTKVTGLGNPYTLDNPWFLEFGFDDSREWQKSLYAGADVVMHLVDAKRYVRRVTETVYGKVLGTSKIDYGEGEYFMPDGGYVVEERPADSIPFATLVTLRGVFGLWRAADGRRMYVTVGPLASPDVSVVAFETMAVGPGVPLADGQHFIRKESRRHYKRGSMFLVTPAAMLARQALAK
jgi:hypothetical protein